MTLISANDLDTSPVQYLDAGNVIPRIGTGFMWGPSTAGKSLVALDLALAVANGTPWLGRKINYPGHVAYCLGEGLSGFGVRTQARLAPFSQAPTIQRPASLPRKASSVWLISDQAKFTIYTQGASPCKVFCK